MVGGTTLFALALATPAILGFSAVGPVAGSIAAGWQASLGIVAAGSPFAFLQSAAMGGAAMGLFTGIGAFGGAIAVGAALASMKPPIAALAEKAKGAMAGLAGEAKGAMAGLAENLNGAMSGLAENAGAAVGGLAHNFMSFFGKAKQE